MPVSFKHLSVSYFNCINECVINRDITKLEKLANDIIKIEESLSKNHNFSYFYSNVSNLKNFPENLSKHYPEVSFFLDLKNNCNNSEYLRDKLYEILKKHYTLENVSHLSTVALYIKLLNYFRSKYIPGNKHINIVIDMLQRDINIVKNEPNSNFGNSYYITNLNDIFNPQSTHVDLSCKCVKCRNYYNSDEYYKQIDINISKAIDEITRMCNNPEIESKLREIVLEYL